MNADERRPSPSLYLRVSALICGSFLLAGCAAKPIVPADHDPPRLSVRAEAVEVGRALAAYNANAVMLQKLWARTDLKLRWLDEEEKKRRETAEGKLIVQQDVGGAGFDGIALTAGKLGQTGLWAGSDGRRVWLFDLRDDGHAWIGHAGQHSLTQLGLPLNLPPEAVPTLLGLRPLDLPAEATVTPDAYLEVRPRPDTRLLLHPRTGLPARAFLLDAYGEPIVIAHLDRYRPVNVARLDADNRPLAPTRVDLYLPAQRTHVALKLSGMTDQRINPAVFDLNVLLQTHQPAVIETVE
jgi:hypothetical protein